MSQVTVNTLGNIRPSDIVTTLTGDTGGAVSPTANNINILGDGVSIAISGNPGTSTLTISATGTTLIDYTNVNTTPYVALPTDTYLSVDCSAGAITVQLPNAATTGRVWIIKDRTGSAATNNITVTTVGGVVTIDGAATFVMNTAYESIEVIGNSSTYEIF